MYQDWNNEGRFNEFLGKQDNVSKKLIIGVPKNWAFRYQTSNQKVLERGRIGFQQGFNRKCE